MITLVSKQARPQGQNRATNLTGSVARSVGALLMATGLIMTSPLSAGEGSWTKLNTTGVGPQNRSSPSAAAVDDCIYVFGGVEDDFEEVTNTFYNDIHRFDPSTSTWTELHPAGLLPTHRTFAATTSRKSHGEFVIYGGSSYDPTFTEFEVFADLWVFSVDNNSWTEIQAENEGPGARNGANIWADNDKLYLFGGLTPSYLPADDLWEYDFGSNRWTELISMFSPGSPTGRDVAYAGAAPKQGKLTIYGGETLDFQTFEFVTLQDVWQLDLDTLIWEEITPAANEDMDIHGNLGASTIMGNHLYVQGGDVPGGESGCGAPFPQNATNAVWTFHLEQHRWSQIEPDNNQTQWLKRNTGVNIDGKFYILGGFDFQCDGGAGPGQIWNNDVFVLDPDA